MVRRNTQQQERMRARHRRIKADCYLCGKPIDYDLKWPDPECFVVDHIRPIAKGGSHTFANTAAAHASCNSKKRARLIAPIVKRSGSFE